MHTVKGHWVHVNEINSKRKVAIVDMGGAARPRDLSANWSAAFDRMMKSKSKNLVLILELVRIHQTA